MHFTAFPSYCIQLLAVLVAFCFFGVLNADEEVEGFHSTVFDPKYIPFQELLITPKTHPGLFSVLSPHSISKMHKLIHLKSSSLDAGIVAGKPTSPRSGQALTSRLSSTAPPVFSSCDPSQ